MNNQITKPITIVRNEFVKNIVELCNNSGLPFFAVEDVLKGVIQEVHSAAQQQLEADTKQYNAALQKQAQENE